MAHYTEQTGFPALPLKAGMKLRIRALSPTTDAEITGVTASLWAIYGRDDSEAPDVPDSPLETLVIPYRG